MINERSKETLVKIVDFFLVYWEFLKVFVPTIWKMRRNFVLFFHAKLDTTNNDRNESIYIILKPFQS